MIQVGLDLTLFIQIVQFLVIVFVANMLILKPIKSTMDARNEKIDGLLKTAGDNMESINASKESYEQKLGEVRGIIGEYQRKMKEEADTKAHYIISVANDDISKSTESARIELKKSIETAKAGLSKEVSDMSAMVRKVVIGDVA